MNIKKRLLAYPILGAVLGASVYFSANTYFNRHKYETRLENFSSKISTIMEPLPSDTIRIMLPSLQLSKKPTQVSLEGYVLEGPGNGKFRQFTLTNGPRTNALDLRNFALSLGPLIDIKPTIDSVLDGTNSVIYPDEVSSRKDLLPNYGSRLKLRFCLSSFFGGI